MQKYWNTVQDEHGNPRYGASVAVQQSGVNSTIYTDSGGTILATNPLTTDATRGYFEFYAAAGTYDLVIFGVGFASYTITNGAQVGLPSGDVTFTQSGTGHSSAGQTVQNKLRQIVSPTDAPFGADPTGVADSTTAFNDWITAITSTNGASPGALGFIPAGVYKLASGLTISNVSYMRIISSAFAKFDCSAQSSGYAITIDGCQYCDFDFGYINCGYSGIQIKRTSQHALSNRLRINRLAGTGRQSAKPSDPLANRLGIYILGPTIGLENYQHDIEVGSIENFDTGVAFSGNNNANGHTVKCTYITGYWFGVYHNASDNEVYGSKWIAAGGSGSDISECVRYGDGSTAVTANVTQGIADPDAKATIGVAQANSSQNDTDIMDNTDTAPTDNGTNNRWATRLLAITSFTPTITDGTHNATASTAVGYYRRLKTSIGDMVYWQATIITSNLGSVSGSVFIGGLPVNSKNTSNLIASVSVGQYAGVTFGAGYTQLTGYHNPNTALVHLSQQGSTKAQADLQDTNLAAATTIVASGWYFV